MMVYGSKRDFQMSALHTDPIIGDVYKLTTNYKEAKWSVKIIHDNDWIKIFKEVMKLN